MTRAYDRRFFAFLAFLFFLAFLGFLGTDNYSHFALLASPAAFASLFFLIFIPRPAERIPEQFRLKEQGDIYRALTGRI